MSITIGSIILIIYTLTMTMPTVLRWPSSTSSHGRTAPSRPRLAPSSSSEGRKIRWAVLRLRSPALPWRLKKMCVKSSVVDIVERSFATNWYLFWNAVPHRFDIFMITSISRMLACPVVVTSVVTMSPKPNFCGQISFHPNPPLTPTTLTKAC